MSQSATSRKNPAVRKAITESSSKNALIKAARSAGQPNHAALHTAVTFPKQQQGRNFDRRSYFDMMSDAMRAYLVVLINPFEMQLMGKSAGIPVAPSVPSRKYACFARGTFSTCPRDLTGFTGGKRDIILALTEVNSGYVMVSPKLFGVSTRITTWDRPLDTGVILTNNNTSATYAAPLSGGMSGGYQINQQPVVYTTHKTPFGCPARFYECNPTLVGERPPITAIRETSTQLTVYCQNPGLAGFSVPTMSYGPTTPCALMAIPELNSNLDRMSSNSDIPWWDVMGPDPYTSTSASNSSMNNNISFNGVYGKLGSQWGGNASLNSRKLRVVACGLRIKYIGTEVNRGGQVIGLREPSGLNMASGAFGGVLYSQNYVTAPSATTAIELTSPSGGGTTVFAPLDTITVNSTVNLAPKSYQFSPQFQSADWRLFGANPASLFGLDVSSATLQPISGQPFSTAINGDDTYGFDQLAAYDQGVPGDVEREWDELVYYPVDPSNAKYEYLYETVTQSESNSLPSALNSVGILGTASVTDTPLPPGTTPQNPSDLKLGHVEFQGTAMKVSDAMALISKNVNRARKTDLDYRSRYLVSQINSLADKPSAENYQKVVGMLQQLTMVPTDIGLLTGQAGSGGDVTVHLKVSRADNDWGYTLGWYVRGADDTTPARFQFEVVGHYEIIGKDIRGQTAAASPDPVGIAALSAASQPSLTHANVAGNRVKNPISVVASNVVQEIQHQSGIADTPTKPLHRKIVEGAQDAVSTVKGVVDAAKSAKAIYNDVKEFAGPIMDVLSALF